ncbi:MAG: ABC transporter permease [Gammaproteobacteria bacterium]|nr:ABC transporter permease [Gammaproteobacteria bacterium]
MLILWPEDTLVLPFAGLFLLICALSLLGPWLLYQGSRAGAVFRPGNWQLVPKVALGNAGRHLDRTGVAVAALSVAVSATLGIELMIQSFRFSVEDWLAHYLRADVYLSTGQEGSPALTEDFLAELRGLPQLRYLSTGRRVDLKTDHGPLTVFAVDMPREGFDGFRIIDGQDPGLWSRFHRDGEVLITESLALRLRLAPGDRVELPTDRGMHRFSIAAVYRDYSSEHGLVTMDRRTWNRYFDDRRQVSAALYLAPGADVARTIGTVQSSPGAPYEMFIRSNRDLRQTSLAVFDHTFRITAVLRLLAVIVAVTGILSALMALLLERRREFAMLSAIGFSRRQIGGLLVLESGLAGLAAGLVAVPLGMLLSLILIRVINVRSFGWSMESLVNWNLAWQAVALSVAAALAAAVYPAWRFRGGEEIRRVRED